MIRCGTEYIDRDLDVHRPRALTAEYPERSRKHLGQLVCAQHGVAEGRYFRSQAALIRQLVEPPFPQPELMRFANRGDHQHRH